MQKLSEISPEYSVKVSADMQAFDHALKVAKESTQDFGKVFSSTIKNAALTGKSFEQTLHSIASRLSNMALNKALSPIENSISKIMDSALSGLGGGASTSVTPFAKGGAFTQGGIVNSPTVFGFGNNVGVMGESGAEAVMPLMRGANGKLGIAAQGQSSNSVNVVFNVNANDAASFQKSEAQVTAMLARAVNKAQRNL